MVDSVNKSASSMGEVYQDGNKFRLFRKHLGFSPDQILTAINKKHEIEAAEFQKKIDRIQQEEDALLQADQYLRKLMSAAKTLSNIGKSSAGEIDVFNARVAVPTASDASINVNNVVLFSPSEGAPEGSLSINIERVATKDKINGSTVHASDLDIITTHETRVYIRGQEIRVPANTSLKGIVQSINAQKATSHVVANIYKFSNTDYRLFLSSTKDGGKITLQTIVDKLKGSFDSDLTALNLAGTLVIDGTEKVVTPSMTLTDIAALISTVPNYGAVVNGSGPYTLNITHNSIAVDLADEAIEKLFDQLGVAENEASEEDLKAKFYIEGEETAVFSDTNHIEDLYPNTAIDLLAPSQEATITVNIEQDRAAVLKAIESFYTAYNELIKFSQVQTAREKKGVKNKEGYVPKEGAYLADNREFLRMIDSLKDVYFHRSQGVEGLNHFNHIGITMREDGTLVSDSDKLAKKINEDLEGVKQVLGFVTKDMTGGYFRVTQHAAVMPEDMLGKEVKVSITKNATGQYSARMYLLDGVTITHDETIYFGDESIIVTAGGGVAFKGPEDTIYKGFEFSYNGPELATPIAPGTTVSEQGFKMSQGVADFLTKGLEAMIMLTVSSDKEIDQKNELNRIALHVKQKKISQEKRLKDMQDKHAKIIEREKRKAERFQERFEKIQKLSMGLQSLTAFWRG